MRNLFALLFVAGWLMVAQAGASVVNSIAGGTVLPFAPVNYFGPGPQTIGAGVTWSSTNADNIGGSTFGFDFTIPPNIIPFGLNGNWTTGQHPAAALNDSYDFFGVSDTMTFAFATPTSAVGGFLNYYPGNDTPTTIAVYDSSCDPRVSILCTPIEPAYNLTFVTDGSDNSGFFYGFQESTRNISYFTLTDNFVGITDLTAVVPEPSSLLLIGTGLLGALGYGRRRFGL